jgi:hypothetical protein
MEPFAQLWTMSRHVTLIIAGPWFSQYTVQYSNWWEGISNLGTSQRGKGSSGCA